MTSCLSSALQRRIPVVVVIHEARNLGAGMSFSLTFLRNIPEPLTLGRWRHRFLSVANLDLLIAEFPER